MTEQAVLTAPASSWRYEEPLRTDAKVLLLTVGRVAVVGNWCGELGQFFVAWSPLPKRDKQREQELGLMSKAGQEQI